MKKRIAQLVFGLLLSTGILACTNITVTEHEPEVIVPPNNDFVIETEPDPVETAIPVPTPVPIDAVRYAALTAGEQAASFVKMSGSSFLLYEAPSLKADFEKLYLRGSVARGEMQLLETVEAEDGTVFYRVRALYAPLSGYVLAEKTEASLVQPCEKDTFALLARSGCALLRDADIESEQLAVEAYTVARVLGTFETFSYVRTEHGAEGFVLTSKLMPLTVSEVEAYLREVPNSNRFSMESFVDAVCEYNGSGDLCEPIYDLLQQQGLVFSRGYYELFEKPLWNETLYPYRHYVDEQYNSRLFRLWNTAGDHVFYDGAPTQWLYVEDAAELERGDLVFLAGYEPTEETIVPEREVILRGRYSGYITAVGVCLGNDVVRIGVDGKLQTVTDFSNSPLADFFDCGRRICTTVTDEEAYLVERMISAMYDRLGTPYDKIDRTTDISYDCSSFVYTTVSNLGVTEEPNGRFPIRESTASRLSQWETLYLGDTPLHFEKLSDELKNMEDLNELQRGDLVFLLGYQRSRVGHVMVMVGTDTVIHSTNIDEEYRFTLVARFRDVLQKDYYLTKRMRLGDG